MKAVALSVSPGIPVSPMNSPEEGLYLHLPDVSGLGALPECGEITFKYRRKKLSLVSEDEKRLSAELCLLEITDVEADENCPEEKTDDVVDALFKEANGGEEKDDSEEKEY